MMLVVDDDSCHVAQGFLHLAFGHPTDRKSRAWRLAPPSFAHELLTAIETLDVHILLFIEMDISTIYVITEVLTSVKPVNTQYLQIHMIYNQINNIKQ